MMEIRTFKGTIAALPRTHCSHIRDSLLLAWVLYGVVRASAALAGEQAPHSEAAAAGGKNSGESQAGTSLFAAPFVSAKPPVQAYSETEFRPRRQAFDTDFARGKSSIIDTPILKSTSVWEQLADYRSQDRVRLLTLWQTKGSSLSLQAGKRGAPSLQWSTPWVHHEGAARGLFDRLLTAQPHTGGSTSPRPNTAHAPATQAPPKSLDYKSLD